MTLSFALYRGEKHSWITLVAFTGLSMLLGCGDYDMSVSKMCYAPNFMLGKEYDIVAYRVIRGIVVAWIWLMPILVYVVALLSRKLSRTELSYKELLGGLLWQENRARTYFLMMLVAVLALFSGLAMDMRVCLFVCVAAPAVSFWLLSGHYQVKANRLWALIAAMIVFFYAQKYAGLIRISMLGASFMMVAWTCLQFYKKKGLLSVAVLATIYFGILLPSLSIGYNQFACINYARKGFNTLSPYTGIFFIKDATGEKVGLRDRYGLLVSPEYDSVFLHKNRYKSGNVEFKKNGQSVYYELYDNTFSNEF